MVLNLKDKKTKLNPAVRPETPPMERPPARPPVSRDIYTAVFVYIEFSCNIFDLFTSMDPNSDSDPRFQSLSCSWQLGFGSESRSIQYEKFKKVQCSHLVAVQIGIGISIQSGNVNKSVALTIYSSKVYREDTHLK